MKKKGVTLVVLAVTVIVMIILATTIVIIASNSVNRTKAMQFAKEMLQVQTQMQKYEQRNNGNIDFSTATITMYSSNAADGEIITSNEITVYVVDLSLIDVEETIYGQRKNGNSDRYLYSSATKKIYYQYGYKYNDVTYYTLKGDLAELIK